MARRGNLQIEGDRQVKEIRRPAKLIQSSVAESREQLLERPE